MLENCCQSGFARSQAFEPKLLCMYRLCASRGCRILQVSAAKHELDRLGCPYVACLVAYVGVGALLCIVMMFEVLPRKTTNTALYAAVAVRTSWRRAFVKIEHEAAKKRVNRKMVRI